MIDCAERPGRPSELHEYRARTLETMAVLTGHVRSFDTLPGRLSPDVLQLRPGDASLFVGDAKATETPGNSATFIRLRAYAEFLSGWVDAGAAAIMALVVDEREAYGWLRVLREVTVDLPHSGGSPARVDRVESGTVVVWTALGLPGGKATS